jgi:integrase
MGGRKSVTPMQTDLPYLSREENRHGNEVLFVRRHGKRIRIREPEGTPAFVLAYTTALDKLEAPHEAGERAKLEAAAKGSLGWLASRYFAESEEFKHLAEKSRQARRSCIEACLQEPRKPDTPKDLMRDCPISIIGPSHVKMLRDRKAGQPGAANNRRKHLSTMFAWAVDEKLMSTNPVRDVKMAPRKKGGGFHTWSIDEVRQFETRHPLGTKARLALALLLFTGARRQDMVLFGRQHVKGGWLRYVPLKTLYKRDDLSQKPWLPELDEIVRVSPCGELTFLVHSHGVGFTANGFGNWFRDRCDEAGLPKCSAHGLRKAGATIAAENGATASQLMAIFDWTTISQAEVYTKAANKKRMAGEAMGMLVEQPANSGLSHQSVALLKDQTNQ